MKSNSKKNYLFNNFSSKVRDVIIELPGFNFFHSPSEVGKLDYRFIGRENIIDRLVSILSNQETKSGAYLVTGYRGMGKTSVVNKAFSQISSAVKPIKKLTRFFKLFMILIIFPIILNESLINNNVFYIITMCIWLICIMYLIKAHWIEPKFAKKGHNQLLRIKHLFIKLLILGFNEKAYSRRIFFVHDTFILVSIVLIARLIEENYTLSYTFAQNLILLYVVYIFCFHFYYFILDYKSVKYSVKFPKLKSVKVVLPFIGILIMNLLGMFRYLFYKVKSNFDNYVSFQRNVFININLGHDVIREIDILRIITKTIHARYKEFHRSFRKNLLWLIPQVGLAIIITILTFNNEVFINSTNMLKKEIQSYLFLPSQNQKILSSRSDDLEEIVLSEINKSGYNKYEYYAFCMYYINSKNELNNYDVNYLKTLVKRGVKEYDLVSLLLNNYAEYEPGTTSVINIKILDKYLFEDSFSDCELSDKTSIILRSKDFIQRSQFDSLQIYCENDSIVISSNALIFYNSFHSLSDWRRHLYRSIGFADLYLNNAIISFQRYIAKSYFNNTKYRVSVDYLFIIILLLIVIGSRSLFYGINYFGRMSPKKIIKKLEFLIDIIDSQLTLQTNNGVQSPVINGASVFKKWSKKKDYKIAGVNDIEYWLIDILNDIEKLPTFIIKPEFILVFDELDKIEAKDDLLAEKPDNESAKTIDSYIFSIDSSRMRQHAIYKLLSNLKYFLTTASAKFIFIAGREMYDAYLADVSDRNFFNRSIFNQVIYVKSFLTEKNDEPNRYNEEFADITGLTENYVCQFLFPVGMRNKGLTLKDYNEYLLRSKEYNDNDIEKNDVEKQIARQKREKIIFLLHQFIIYLMHISNGAPKKITSTFEKYVYSGTMVHREIMKNDPLIVSNNQDNHHLFFNHENQYMIGMISSLINPIFYYISAKVHDYEDKSLVSATFLINHMFKFHNYGFSWSNLEHTPEIIEIHKTPEFRGFVNSIMQFLTQTHIEEIVSGLYQYKFPKRISKEISYISKISGESAATFNFTLDDQLLVKQYYIDQLQILEERYKNIYGQGQNNQLIHSIASLHITLGDIYYYEEDLGKAIQQYQDGVQFMRIKPEKEMKVYDFIVWVRSMLKLGLAFEKRKTNDSAFLIYGELCDSIIRYREFDLSKIGLDIRTSVNPKSMGRQIFVKDRNLTEINRRYHENIETLTSQKEFDPSRDIFTEIIDNHITPEKEAILFRITTFEGIRLVYQPFLAKLQIIEKSNLGGITMEDLVRLKSEFDYMNRIIRVNEKYLIETEFWNKVGDILYYKNGLIQYGTNSIYNQCDQGSKYSCDICLVCEKIGLSGTEQSESNQVYNCEYNRVKSLSKGRKIPCVSCTYYDKSLQVVISNSINWTNKNMKDFLINNQKDSDIKAIIIDKYDELDKRLYKSGVVSEEENTKTKRKANNIISEIITSTNNHLKSKKSGDKNIGSISITDLFNNYKASKDTIYLNILFKAWRYKSFKSLRKNSLTTLAGLLTNIGDVRLSCSNNQDQIKKDSLQRLKILIDNSTDNKNRGVDEKDDLVIYSKLDSALHYYFLSALFYKNAKEFKNYSYQMIKIMHVLREYTSWPFQSSDQYLSKESRINSIENFVDFIEDVVSTRVLKANFGAYENIHTFMVEKFRNTFNTNDKLIKSKYLTDYISLKKLPIDTELEELIYCFYHIKLKCSKKNGFNPDCFSSDYLDKSIDKNNNDKDIYGALLFNLFKHNLASPFLVENNMFNCIIKLRFKEMLNYKILRFFDLEPAEKSKCVDNKNELIDYNIIIRFVQLFISPLKDESSDNIKYLLGFTSNLDVSNKKEPLEKLSNLFELILCDSIYCLLEVVKKYHIFSQAFIFTHSYIAETHFYLMKWIKIFDLYNLFTDIVRNHNNLNNVKDKLIRLVENKSILKKNYQNNIDNIDKLFRTIEPDIVSFGKEKQNQFEVNEKLNSLISKDDWQYLSINYQSERAVKEYWAAKETHNEGNAYQNLTENMYYLNDDFNDKLFHFRLAQERYRINTSKIDSRIEMAKEYGQNSSLYVIESYLKTIYNPKRS